MSRIISVAARQVFDSRGNPTVEVDLQTGEGIYNAIAPSGAPGYGYESYELRDRKPSYHGMSVFRCIELINTEISEAIEGMDPMDQEGIDQVLSDLDGTTNKSRLGANTLLAVSMAVCRAGAAKKGVPLYRHINNLAALPQVCLPVPCMNMIAGGSLVPNRVAMQEFMIMPIGAENFTQAMQMGTEIYHKLGQIITKSYGAAGTLLSDEGAYVPMIADNTEALRLIKEAIAAAGYTDQVSIAIDVAATRFYDRDQKRYDLDFKNAASDGKKRILAEQLLTMYKKMCASFDIIVIEDPFEQNDFDMFSRMTKELGEVVQVVGDDLLLMNGERVDYAVHAQAANGLLLNLSQAGTVSEAIQIYTKARDAGWGCMVTHQLADTEDTFIADLVVGLGAGQIKAGAPCRSERVAKYNQLLRIESDLDDGALYAGEYFRDPWLIDPSQARSGRV
mmetsp:Transcript_4584/g.9172  ORF Transcript_4584/g.9172 Transcript_4584/m.9172 type:complete len:448 (-) Transcript_4584:1680-3023(-)